MSRVSLSCDHESASQSSFIGLMGTLAHEFSVSGRGWNVQKTTNFRGFRDFSSSELPKGLILAKKLGMWIKGSPFLFEINVGKSRIRHRTTMHFNDAVFNWFWVDLEIQFQSRSMSDPSLADIDFKNKMVWVLTTLKDRIFYVEKPICRLKILDFERPCILQEHELWSKLLFCPPEDRILWASLSFGKIPLVR